MSDRLVEEDSDYEDEPSLAPATSLNPFPMNWKELSNFAISKKRYDLMQQYLENPQAPFDDKVSTRDTKWVKARAKQFNIQLRNDKLYAVANNPPPSYFNDDTGGRVIRNTQDEWALVVVYKERVIELIDKVYNNITVGGYRGREALYAMLLQRFVGITKMDVVSYLNNREVHQVMKQAEQRVLQPLRPKHINHWWQLDVLYLRNFAKKDRNSTFEYILTVIDIFSKYTWVKPLKSRTMAEITQVMQYIILQNGAPKILHGDNEFKVEGIFELKKLGIESFRFGRAYNSRSQGQVERQNRLIRAYINKYQQDYNVKNWVSICPLIEANINYSKHTTTKRVPFEVYRGYAAPTFVMLEMLDNTLEDTPVNATTLREQDEELSQARANMQLAVAKQINTAADKMIKNDIKKLPAISLGDFVRISVFTKTKYREAKKQGEQIRKYWSKKIFEVQEAKVRNGMPSFKLIHPNTKDVIDRYYTRAELLLIDKEKLVKQRPENQPEIYTFGDQFDLNRYLKENKDAPVIEQPEVIDMQEEADEEEDEEQEEEPTIIDEPDPEPLGAEMAALQRRIDEEAKPKGLTAKERAAIKKNQPFVKIDDSDLFAKYGF